MEQELPEELQGGFKLEVESYFDNVPLQEFLHAYVPTESDRYLKKLVDRGLVKVNGQTRPLNFRVKAGDRVEVGQPEREPSEPTYPDPETIWHDEQVAVVEKYPGQKIGTEVAGTVPVNQKLPDEFLASFPLPPNRAVYPLFSVPIYASGLVVLVGNESRRNELREQLGTPDCRVVGEAVLDGRMSEERIVEEALIRSSRDPGIRVVDQEGEKKAKTEIRPVEKFRKFTHAEIVPRTAVDHQVRAHSKYIHHPLSVDPEYGYREELMLSEFKEDYREKPFQEERPLIQRLTLHWSEATFPVETETEPVSLSSERPEDMEITLKQLQNHGG